MKQINLIKICLMVLFSIVLSTGASAQDVLEEQTPKAVEELRKAILEVLQETGTPAAGIALVNKGGPVWIEGLGLADRKKEIEADEETLFRIGSTSKVFVALAILKLKEQGKLTLKDKVRDLIPEIEFKNAWEETNPVLVEHLLEHTTGWDDLHLIEYNQKGSRMWSLKEALAFHPHSRISRWVPGTRMAYSNTGPNVAAYIVEKVTGQPFEQYIRENFFSPMGMETMTYFLSEEYKQKGATLYNQEGFPSDYGHMLMRASGSVNASPKDMAKLVELFINRGKLDSAQLISENSLKRMETPSTTSGAKAGLKYGYGLSLYSSPHNEFTYYKHGGGVGNGISDFSYLPEYGLGYSILINSGKAEAIRKISKLVRDFQTQNLPLPEKPATASFSGVFRSINGYYQPVNFGTGPLKVPPLTARRVWTEGDTLYTQYPAHMGATEKYIAVDDQLYQSLKTRRADLIFVNDPLAGEVFELANRGNGTLTFDSVPAALLFAKTGVLILWVLLILLAFLLLPVSLYRYWSGRIPGGANVLIRIWPLLPVGFLLFAFVLFAGGGMDGIEPLAEPSLFSVGIMISTISFFLTAFFSFVMAVRYKDRGIKRSVYVPATFLSGLHLLVAFYLLAHGVIGLMTWA